VVRACDHRPSCLEQLAQGIEHLRMKFRNYVAVSPRATDTTRQGIERGDPCLWIAQFWCDTKRKDGATATTTGAHPRYQLIHVGR